MGGWNLCLTSKLSIPPPRNKIVMTLLKTSNVSPELKKKYRREPFFVQHFFRLRMKPTNRFWYYRHSSEFIFILGICTYIFHKKIKNKNFKRAFRTYCLRVYFPISAEFETITKFINANIKFIKYFEPSRTLITLFLVRHKITHQVINSQ